MDPVILRMIGAVLFVAAGPFAGMLLKGIDRKLTARMQGRVGPPVLQPLYDVRKLLSKEEAAVNGYIDFYVLMALVVAVLSGTVFFAGGNLLISVFLLTLSSLFLILSGYSASSPYSVAGAQRENAQVMAYEPLMLLMPMAAYIVCGSPDVSALLGQEVPLVATIPLVFVAFLFILTIKLRKSPFDLSTSHHAHQELVKGITTDISGRTLAMYEVMEWYETVIFMGMVGMFIVSSAWWSWIMAAVVIAAVFVLEILIDNNAARVKWKTMLASSWAITLVLVGVNLAVVQFA